MGCFRRSKGATKSQEQAPKLPRTFFLWRRKQKAPEAEPLAAWPCLSATTAQTAVAQEAPSQPDELLPPGIQDSSNTSDDAQVVEPSLRQATRAAAVVEAISERIGELSSAAAGAKAHRPNCLALASFASTVGNVLQTREHAVATANSKQLDKLVPLLGNCITLTRSCSKPDWLLLAASAEEGVCEAMQLLHSSMLAILKAQNLNGIPGAGRLAPPEYHDGARSLQRRLKQLGSGSLLSGIKLVAGSEDTQMELAHMLELQPEEVAASAHHILESGVLANAAVAATGTSHPAIIAHRAALEQTFTAYATFGARDAAAVLLDSFRCNKLAREAGLLGSSLTSQQLDLLFTQATTSDRQGRRLSFDGFLTLLVLIAAKKCVLLEDVVAAVVKLGGQPKARATTPEHVKWHDCKELYTGVYARGMSVVDVKLDLRSMVDRDAAEKAQRRTSLANSRLPTPPISRTLTDAAPSSGSSTPHASMSGAAGSMGGGRPSLRLPLHLLDNSAGNISHLRHSGFLSARGPPADRSLLTLPSAKHTPLSARGRPTGNLTPRLLASHALTPSAFQQTPTTPAVEEDAETQRLREHYTRFALFGRSATGSGEVLMGDASFMKMCRDTSLLTKQLTSTRVDLIFRMTVSQGAHRISFEQFQGALGRVAEARGCSRQAVVDIILGSKGPSLTSTTTPENMRLFEEKTGIAARGGPTTVGKRLTLDLMCDRSGRRSSLAVVQ